MVFNVPFIPNHSMIIKEDVICSFNPWGRGGRSVMGVWVAETLCYCRISALRNRLLPACVLVRPNPKLFFRIASIFRAVGDALGS